MTPRETQRQLEMDRGRQIAQRAKRQSDLSRLIEGKKVQVMCAMPGHMHYEDHGRVNLFDVAGVRVAHQNEADDDYPSEVVMAMIGIAVAATVGLEGVPSSTTIDESTRKRRNEYRERMGRGLRAVQGEDKF